MDIGDIRSLFKTCDINIPVIYCNVPGYGFREYHSVLHDTPQWRRHHFRLYSLIFRPAIKIEPDITG